MTRNTRTNTDRNTYYIKKKRKSPNTTGILILITIVGFILLFTYLSLNLKNIDFGYEMQKLIQRERQLIEEIDKLKCEKARLLNLERVEKKVIKELGYQYPEPDQFIRVIDKSGSTKR